MSRNGFVPILIIIIIAIALVLGGGVLYYTKRSFAPATSDTEVQQQSQAVSSGTVEIVFPSSSTPTAQKSVSVSPGSASSGSNFASNTVINFTPSIPAGWKKYRNTKYGFEIFYPADHTAYNKINPSGKSLMAAGSSDDEINIAEDESKFFSYQSQAIVLKIVIVNEDTRIDDWVDQNISKYVSDITSISRKKTTVSGKTTVEITQPAQGVNSVHKLVVIQPGNYFIVITESAPSIILDQIFTTFKFIN